MADLTAVLLAATSADPAAQQAAEAQLAALEAAGFAPFVAAVAAELAGETKPAGCRVLAGLVLKNAVYSEDAGRRAEKGAKWVEGVPSGVKAQIRAALLATLASEVRGARAWGGGGGRGEGGAHSVVNRCRAPGRRRRR